jgi:hypothetical protein
MTRPESDHPKEVAAIRPGEGDSRQQGDRSIRASTAAFVVRVWVEERSIEGAKPLWRGEIQDAQSGERSYFDDLAEVGSFIAKRLRRLGIESPRVEERCSLSNVLTGWLRRDRRRTD